MENVNQLTEKDVTEILSQREELLEGYRKRLEMLSREYEDAGELIEMLQLRSPSNDQEGSKSQEIKGLDDIYMLYEKQKKTTISHTYILYRSITCHLSFGEWLDERKRISAYARNI